VATHPPKSWTYIVLPKELQSEVEKVAGRIFKHFKNVEVVVEYGQRVGEREASFRVRFPRSRTEFLTANASVT
jgi:hypothetical protein